MDMGKVFAEMGIVAKQPALEEIRELAKRWNLEYTDGELYAYSGDIRRLDECLSACAACPGLEACPLEPTGYEVVASRSPIGGTSQFAIRPCSKRAQYEERVRGEELLASSRVPAYLRTKTFKNYDAADTQEAVKYAAAIVRGQATRGAIFYGPPGVGKTHLAAAILNNRIQAGKTGIYATVPELMDDLRVAMQNDTIQRARALMVDTDFLFLDDIGAEKPSEFVVEELFKIVNGRLLKGGITIGTTNLDPDGFRQRYAGVGGARIISRLYEACEWIPVAGQDRRFER